MNNVVADIVIIGAGIAGLSTALYLNQYCPEKKILILDKGNGFNSNTHLAQGGIAAVFDWTADSFEFHARDTMEAGRYKNEPEIVNKVVTSAPKAVIDLMSWGVEFDRDESQNLALGLEGGHSYSRIVHHKDATGESIQKLLMQKIKSLPQIDFLAYYLATDLWIVKEECKGVIVYSPHNREVFTILSRFVILATGGSGQVFEITTNPPSATGDGLAIAIRAGAVVEALEYYQFHPTALFVLENGRNLLITEALRGAGAYVVNQMGERFLLKHDARGELSTRDKVTFWIFEEMKRSDVDHVFLDARHLGTERLKGQFPNVYENCLRSGFDLAMDLVPIVPAAHYQCGGVKVNKNGETSISNLFAVGECAHTGLHGANRLASNSLPEAMVFAEDIAKYLSKLNKDKPNTIATSYSNSKSIQLTPGQLIKIELRTNEIRKFMSEAFLTQLSNEQVRTQVCALQQDFIDIEIQIAIGFMDDSILIFKNLITVAKSMLESKYNLC